MAQGQDTARYRTTFVRLTGFLRPYKWSMIVSVALAVGSQAAQLALLWLPGNVALVAIASGPLIVAIAYRYSHIAHPVLRDVQQKLADVATVAEENIVGVHVVKSFAQEDAEQAKFEHRSEAVFSQSVRANRM